jgi:hypothetical protein
MGSPYLGKKQDYINMGPEMYKEWCLLGCYACGSCKNRHFGGTWRLLHQGDKNR